MQMGRNRGGFSLSELLVVMGIIAVLSAILYPVFSAARESTRVVACSSNLQQIGVAAGTYYADFDGPPMSQLTRSLGEYVNGPEVFICPDDPTRQDSYSAYFVGRHNPALSSEFVVGCPRHNHGHRQTVALGRGSADLGPVGVVKHNDADIRIGDVVEGGTLHFADESTLNISDGLTVCVLASVSGKAGLHTVVWVPGEQDGWVEASVTPGNRFEVVTPDTVAAVRGTKFCVYVHAGQDSYQDSRSFSYVKVHEGQVMVNARTGPGQMLLKPGRSAQVWSYLPPGHLKAGSSAAERWGPGPWRGNADHSLSM